MPLHQPKEKDIRVTASIPKELFFRLHAMESIRGEIIKEALKEYLDNRGY